MSQSSDGYIDFHGYHDTAGGWLFCGWVTEPWDGGLDAQLTAVFDDGELSGTGQVVFFHRGDLGGKGTGLLLFVPASSRAAGVLRSLRVGVAGREHRLAAAAYSAALRERDLSERTRQVLASAESGGGRSTLRALMARRSFTGVETLSELSEPVRFGVDEAIACPPDGLILAGWLLCAPNALRQLRLRCGGRTTPIVLADCIRIDRADVLDAFPGFGAAEDRRCGFIAYLPNALPPGERPYLEVETSRGEVGYGLIPLPTLRGLAAMKRLLGLFEPRYAEVPAAFDKVAGPGLQALNRDRLLERPEISVLEFGPAEPAPDYSIIIPLHRRIDFLEYQLARFSSQDHAGHEFLYVLDDPDRACDAQRLAESAYERFQVPFRLIVLSRNLGYAPANNIGLQQARGRVTCFLNSDVLPERGGWMAALAARLDADPGLGAVGPLLLFEDGSVQHQGIEFEPVAQFGQWLFPQHVRKGWKPAALSGLQPCRAITGACLAMRTAEARAIGGFDEIYAIGDFEDTDLCLRLAERGLACALDHDVSLFHLERRSQTGPGQRWRINLTLYNAWLHQRRWSDRLVATAPVPGAERPRPGRRRPGRVAAAEPA